MFDERVEDAGEVALDATADFPGGLALGGAAGGGGDGGRVVAEPAECDGVQCAVGVAVAVGVEAVAGSGCGWCVGGAGWMRPIRGTTLRRSRVTGRFSLAGDIF